MGDTGWGIVFVLTIGVVLAALVALTIWLSFRIWQTRVTISTSSAHDADYRTLATDATETQRAIAKAQQELAAQQRQSAADLAELRGRITNIEKLLRDVG
jgi:predicted negative regulator of RcsB-dependent stress response